MSEGRLHHPLDRPDPTAPVSILGVDVGGTKVSAARVSFPEGVIHGRRRWPTFAHRGGEAVLTDVAKALEGLAAEARAEGAVIRGLGIGICELVGPTGHVLSGHTVDWRGLAIAERLHGLAPVTLEADVRAAAVAESLFGAGRGLRQFVYLTVGTGISSCLVLDGRPYLGARGATGTIASSPFLWRCETCRRLDTRSLEELASGPGILTRYRARHPQSAHRAEDVLAAAARGEAEAVEVVESAGAALGIAGAWLINTLDPEALVVGGGLGLAGGLYWDAFVHSARRHIWSEIQAEIPILPGGCDLDSGVLGAAAIAWQRLSH
ncbi:MAG: ROK family protein [Verrucomicrobiales bacterium]|nr:ROK family protein [Verrucomicrobiales bacterium]